MENSSLINGDPVPSRRKIPVLGIVIGVIVVASVIVLGLTFTTGNLLGRKQGPRSPPTSSPCPSKDPSKPCTTKYPTTKPGTTSPQCPGAPTPCPGSPSPCPGAPTPCPVTTTPGSTTRAPTPGPTTTPPVTTPNVTTPVQTTRAPTPSPTNATTSPPNTTLPATTLPVTTLPVTTIPVTTIPGIPCNATLCELRDLIANLTAALDNNRTNSHNFYFDAMGDTAYNVLPTDSQRLQDLIDNVINKESPRFVVHIGDYQVPLNTTAADAAINYTGVVKKRNVLWQIKHPFIFTPGDNDWSDIPAAFPSVDPIQLLEDVRNAFYRNGTNVPFPFVVVSQDVEQGGNFTEFVENRRWIIEGIVFATFHTVSGNNGLAPTAGTPPNASAAIIAESQLRIQADVAWIQRAFEVANLTGAPGLVLFSHANPGFATSPTPTGFAAILGTIYNLTRAANAVSNNTLNVLFVYGDSHVFTVNKLLPESGNYPPPLGVNNTDLLEYFTALQVPGNSLPFAGQVPGAQGRVKVKVDFSEPGLFSIYTHVRSL